VDAGRSAACHPCGADRRAAHEPLCIDINATLVTAQSDDKTAQP